MDEIAEHLSCCNGKHYVVRKDSALSRLVNDDCCLAPFYLGKDSSQVRQNKRNGRAIKVVYPLSSQLAIKYIMEDKERYVKGNTNSSVSIRDYLLNKGDISAPVQRKNKEQTMNIKSFLY